VIDNDESGSGSDRKRSWHLNKEVQVSHILSTLMIAATAAVYVLRLESRTDQHFALVDYQIQQQIVRDDRQDAASVQDRVSLHEQLEKLSSKVDRLLEATYNGRGGK
jgi:hypothetical protein